MERHGQRFEAEFIRQTEFLEAEEVLVNVFCEVAADELFRAIVEGAYAVRTGIVCESGTL